MMTGYELNELYGTMIMPTARIDIPEQWMPIVHEAMQAFVELPSEVRMFVIVVGIVRDDEGTLTFEVATAYDYVSPSGTALIRAITDRAVAKAKLGSMH